MYHHLRHVSGAILLMFAVTMLATPHAYGQSFGANLGSLQVGTFTKTGSYCTEANGTTGNYHGFQYTNFVYTPASGVSGGPQSLPGTAWYVTYSTGGGGTCLSVGTHPVSLSGNLDGNSYFIAFVPTSNGGHNAYMTMPGYINPKYIVVGIIYSPSGSGSKVDYSQSNLVSSTVTTKESFTNGYTQTNTQLATGSFGVVLHGYKLGGIDTSVKNSTSYTQATTTTDSTAVTVQQTTGTETVVPGPTCDYCGVDHDYDQILVWLNPVVTYNLLNNGVVQATGYGFSTYDQPGVDVYPVYVGELNGDLPVRPSTTQAFARGWASVFQWPSGEGPALTAQDEQKILQMDPYWGCTYKTQLSDPNEATECPEPPDVSRFTEATSTSFPYTQAEVGAQPSSKTYTWSYTNTDSQGLDEKVENDQTIGYEYSFGYTTPFGVGFQDTLSQSYTMQYTYEASNQFTNTSTSTASATITQAQCNVVNGACDPWYPPANAYDPTVVPCAPLSLGPVFGQGDSLYIYMDNLFGTFLTEPYGQI